MSLHYCNFLLTDFNWLTNSFCTDAHNQSLFLSLTQAHAHTHTPFKSLLPSPSLTPHPRLSLPHFPTLPTASPSQCECSAGVAGMVECRQSWAPGTCGRCHTGKINMPDWQLETCALPQAQIQCRCAARYSIQELTFWQEEMSLCIHVKTILLVSRSTYSWTHSPFLKRQKSGAAEAAAVAGISIQVLPILLRYGSWLLSLHWFFSSHYRDTGSSEQQSHLQ